MGPYALPDLAHTCGWLCVVDIQTPHNMSQRQQQDTKTANDSNVSDVLVYIKDFTDDGPRVTATLHRVDSIYNKGI